MRLSAYLTVPSAMIRQLATALLLSIPAVPAKADPPNIIFILADDLGYGSSKPLAAMLEEVSKLLESYTAKILNSVP